MRSQMVALPREDPKMCHSRYLRDQKIGLRGGACGLEATRVWRWRHSREGRMEGALSALVRSPSVVWEGPV